MIELKFKKTIQLLMRAKNEESGLAHLNKPWEGDSPEVAAENAKRFEAHDRMRMQLEDAIEILKAQGYTSIITP